MTSRERLLGALKGEAVDYVPCSTSFNPLTAVQRKGHRWQFPWPPDATAEERIRYQVEQLGIDPVVGIQLDARCPGAEVKYKIWKEGDVLHKTYSTLCGELHAAIRYNELWPHGDDIPFYSDFNIGHFIKPWIQTEQDLACLKEIHKLVDSAELRARAASACAEAQALAGKYHLATMAPIGSGLTGAQLLFGAKELCLMTIEQPNLVDAYLEHEHQLNLRTIEVLGEFGVDIGRRNGFYETADFYGPAMLERFLGARLRREAAAIHDAGMVMSYTVHTGVMPILDHLAGLPMDNLFGIDIAFKRTDLRVLRDKLCPAKSLWIGPSSTFHIWEGPEATRQAVRQVFEVVGKTGLILGACVSSHSIMPWESTLAMIDEWKQLR
jgi:hypothetical protein